MDLSFVFRLQVFVANILLSISCHYLIFLFLLVVILSTLMSILEIETSKSLARECNFLATSVTYLLVFFHLRNGDLNICHNVCLTY